MSVKYNSACLTKLVQGLDGLMQANCFRTVHGHGQALNKYYLELLLLLLLKEWKLFGIQTILSTDPVWLLVFCVDFRQSGTF